MNDLLVTVPDITVVVDRGEQFSSIIEPSEIYQVVINSIEPYNVSVMQPNTVLILYSGSYLKVADYAYLSGYAESSSLSLLTEAIRVCSGTYDIGETEYTGSFSGSSAYFGELVVGTGSLDPSAILHIDSINKGFLPPRMTEAQKLAIVNPTEGLVVYCYDHEALQVYIPTQGGWRTLRHYNDPVV